MHTNEFWIFLITVRTIYDKTLYSIFKRIQKHSLKITSRLVISNINTQWKFQIAPIDSIWIANKKKKKTDFIETLYFLSVFLV